MYRHLLVPTDGTELSNELIASAVGLARALGARVTFFHAQREYAASLFGDGALMHLLSPDIFAEIAAGDGRAVLAKAETYAVEAGVAFGSVLKVSDYPHEAILQTAKDCGCDLICMASHGRKGIKSVMLGSQTQKVLSHAQIPVLIGPSESSSSAPMMNKTIAIMQDEHRSLAVMIYGIRHLLQTASNEGLSPDFSLLRSMLYYIETFPQKLHHPKEEHYIFPRLRGRTSELDQVIAELSVQHREDSYKLNQLKQALATYEADPGRGADESITALDVYMDFTRAHMSTEDKFILPAARRYIPEPEWAEIAEAFGKNGDPNFGTDLTSAFRILFTRIANRTAARAKKADPA
ncbi:universal stress protein [Aromatoleum petrolei]|uniref:Universal stress protein UspA n=1 Tax=Aromatoleum petrolei TaxID=76116 RepID=A0ABX1MRG8_9RHOO|nr:universal stress protein [Aromatoleum petrolei]NMF88584.1 universal stress protein UspA [Aromatoleum petrolei]QTQ34708.1 Universal stress protein A [Aromatoleum petrolei]